MNYPRFRAGDKVLRVRKIKPRTVIEARAVAGTYSYRLKGPGGQVEEAYETELRRANG